MTSHEFIIWLKGFSRAANSYNVTPEQWETIMEELDKVQDPRFLPDYTPKPTYDPKAVPEPIKIWYSTDTNSISKDKTILND